MRKLFDLAVVVHHMQECDQFLIHSISGYFSYQNRLGTRVSESLLYNQREFALFVIPEESGLAQPLSRDLVFLCLHELGELSSCAGLSVLAGQTDKD